MVGGEVLEGGGGGVLEGGGWWGVRGWWVSGGGLPLNCRWGFRMNILLQLSP